MKTIACKDMGMNCPFIAKGTNDNETVKVLMQHAEKSHMNEIKKMQETMSEAEIKDKMRELIKDE